MVRPQHYRPVACSKAWAKVEVFARMNSPGQKMSVGFGSKIHRQDQPPLAPRLALVQRLKLQYPLFGAFPH